ncbi:MAG: dephospho-CoA kinase [Rhodospirillales bacterium 12-54-5]|nr:MAG: dephospho-CoA kinase [Rhodospirillales bacterium 12-54-5]
MTFVIGITGGIASGKSTVARMFAKRIPHIDADKLVHHLLAHDKTTVAQIARHFADAVEGGSVNRKKLGAAIAGNPEKLKQLELILHPRVRDAEEQAILRATRQRRKAILLDIPLLFETGADALCDVVIAVSAPLPMRRRRAMARKHMTTETYDRLVARQLTDAERCARADIVIPSSIGKAHTRRIVEKLLREWKLA